MRLVRLSVVLVVLTGSALVLGPQASALPITSCGTTATTNVRLATDLICLNVSGIIVGKNGITIDLGGHTLTGNRTGGRQGIDDAGGFDNVTVKSGTVTKFEVGVYGNAADGMHVERVVASGNAGHGIFIVGFSPQVSSSQTSGNTGFGIYMDGASALVSSSQASGNGNNGINISGASARVTTSRVFGNAGHGISISGASARVSSSHASGNGSDGIFISGASARLTSSRAFGNDSYGIEVAGNAPKIGQLPRGRASDKNHADANGFVNGASDSLGTGIQAGTFTTAPVGRNVASGNDNPAECDPSNLC